MSDSVKSKLKALFLKGSRFAISQTKEILDKATENLTKTIGQDTATETTPLDALEPSDLQINPPTETAKSASPIIAGDADVMGNAHVECSTSDLQVPPFAVDRILAGAETTPLDEPSDLQINPPTETAKSASPIIAGDADAMGNAHVECSTSDLQVPPFAVDRILAGAETTPLDALEPSDLQINPPTETAKSASPIIAGDADAMGNAHVECSKSDLQVPPFAVDRILTAAETTPLDEPSDLQINPPTETAKSASPIIAGDADAMGNAHVECSTSDLQVPPFAVDRILFEHEDRGQCPHLLKLLVSISLRTRETSPICVILPSAVGVASLVAIVSALECLAQDLPDAKTLYPATLRAGLRVRLYPGGEVFEVGDPPVDGSGSMKLRLIDKKSYATKGTRFVQAERICWFEPTTRYHPLGTGAPFIAPPLNDLDAILGQQAFGNSGLVKTRVLLAGTRAEFGRLLEATHIVPREKIRRAVPLSDVFAFGGVDINSQPYVTAPIGSAGQPMVAIGRDLQDLKNACLNEDVDPHSRVVLCDNVDIILRDLDLAGRIAERQRIVLFAGGLRRADAGALKNAGWVVWEPSPGEVLGVNDPLLTTACRGIDLSRRSASGEQDRRPGYVACKAPEVANAHKALARLGDALGDESIEHEFWVEDLLDAAQSLFFSCAGWLSPPKGETLERVAETLERLRAEAPRLTRLLGDAATKALADLAKAVEEFATSEMSVTPKGEEVLRLAQTAARSSLRQVFVAGNRQGREEADKFFARNGLETRCIAVVDLADAGEPQSVAAFSVMRRDIFEKLVDPWPAGSMLFVGYDFEIDCYRARLNKRAALRASNRLAPEARRRLTGWEDNCFPPESRMAPQASEVGRGLDGFDKIAREWSWSRRISVPVADDGEETCQATVVHFIGRSWCAMTEDHRPLVLTSGSRAGQGTVQEIGLSGLASGSRIVVREGANKDIIRTIAESIAKPAVYADLRNKAALWRQALPHDPAKAQFVARALAKVGVHRHHMTIRSWLANSSLIGPRSEHDIHAIAEAFPVRGRTKADWQACCDAIAQLRALHIRAGSQLTNLLAERCGRVLFEPSDTELAVDLGIGVVWILEVASIEAQAHEFPSSYVNRLHWLDLEWRDRLLASPIRDRAA
ncbi:DrmE family protein [Methylocystis echinoides]|uniref:Uncharacterized protein n=1 Tax=Methylocystis echinoides TaxID=29468 RepID=A0A9W6GXC2_9HYPH|nr:DrmE family protein [Methylocystis echinoides]GLI94666.1 hypothetical protein LMG27198_36580 [Methylocystis echinoides]